jgi:antitoxin HicB
VRNQFFAHFFQTGDEPGWNVRIPWLDGREEGAVTCGDTLEEARQMASELVDTWISIHLENGNPIPTAPVREPEPGWEIVSPGYRMSWCLALRELRAANKWTQNDVAKILGIKQPVYARLEDPRIANPTLTTVDKASRKLGLRLS